jgi:hypothetical protein
LAASNFTAASDASVLLYMATPGELRQGPNPIPSL